MQYLINQPGVKQMLTIKERLARLKIRNWLCSYTNELGTLSIARFETKEDALQFSKAVNGAVSFDTWGV